MEWLKLTPVTLGWNRSREWLHDRGSSQDKESRVVRDVFVTGGTGFIGAHVVRSLLAANYRVRALVRPQSRLDNLAGLDIETVTGDVNSPELVQLMQGCDAVCHVAAHYSLWRRDRDRLHQVNVLGTRHVLESAQAAGVERVVYTSSVAAIGVKPGGQVADETYQSPPHRLISAYKQSKYWAEQEAHRAIERGQDIVIVNPSTPIGPRDIKPTPTGDIIRRFLQRQMPAYVNTGLNFIDVRDVARGHVLALERGKTGERYILGHQNLSFKAFLDKLAHHSGLEAPRYTVPLWLPLAVAWVDEILLSKLGKSPSVPLDGVRMSAEPMYYDASKAVRELGLPQSNLDEAIAAAINWMGKKGIEKM
ncbi:NAD-dependent epimerase/dehydratase family protein [Geitlerinema sp. P-1104]|nr:hopanoid-associated sugar epimerase [Geitlerinema sp. P-1104]NMG58333.1 NAD-dependent epimerase/dehydratase family protein [Geitlerinema sp. P-1104]